uniref:UDENN domain-containing protein n=1 Tax=Strigamia maritima TaxID=126957 RepID=T1IWF4_STRMM
MTLPAISRQYLKFGPKMAAEVTDSELNVDVLLNDVESTSPPLLPWDRFFHWLHCICVVTFDLELGQAMEIIYPGHVKLTEKEKMNICYLSFPDSNSGCMGDTQFHFRIRQCPGRRSVIPMHALYNRECPTVLQIDSSYFYGYVYFRQVKDKSLRRGYFQKSLVLITRFPFVQLFSYVVKIVAPEYFKNGDPSIEAACHDIDQWPAPVPGSILNLPILGNVLQVQIPNRSEKLSFAFNDDKDIINKSYLPAPCILPSISDVNMFKCFCPVLSHIQLLWELVITAEPIVVMASSPTVCSEMVQALTSMIWPLKYCGDFRPFFTIHDSEFKEYTTKTQAPPPVILGVTNPFFAKTLQHWPHILRIGDCISGNSPGSHKNKIKKAGNLKTIDSKPGVYTRYKPFLQKDKVILRKLIKGMQTERPAEVQNALLKRHLVEITQSFIIPLERYMASLMPLQRNISPHKAAPNLRPFNPDDFVKSLDVSGPQLTTGVKGDWVGLYRKFFRSATFSCWYNMRYRDVTKKLQALHLEALSDADLQLWIKDKQEVEVVDLVLKIKDKLEIASSENLPVTESTLNKLQSSLESIIYTLPDDLQGVLKSS